MNDLDLLYAATARCKCGAGLAYQMDREARAASAYDNAWTCAAVLKNETTEGEHDSYHWALYKIREETSINNSGGWTTRPNGTIALTVGRAICSKCQTAWESEPYSACGLGHHWFSGPCPACSYAVGAEGSWSSREGEPLEHRYRDVVLPAEAEVQP